ncbi:MAG: glycerophosphodiester phosphodiesterase [Bacteroidota bacterium]
MRLIIVIFTLIWFSCNNVNTNQQNSTSTSMENTKKNQIDWQGHRGARGILPENTIPAFLKALEYSVTTLELDIAISKDSVVIVSHEPWFNHAISTHPDGTPITEEEEKDLAIYEMTYEQIKEFDVGSRGNPKFPDQKPMKAHKPSLADMVNAVKKYCKENEKPLPNYNIEVKSQPSYYDKKTPAPAAYVKIVLDEVDRLGIKDQSNLQSFDINILEEIHRQSPSTVVAYLVESTDSLAKTLEKISFKPDIFSPYFLLLNQEIVDALHAKDIKVIPWTVNRKEDMKRMIEIGVDGIITDYPNYIEEVSKM